MICVILLIHCSWVIQEFVFVIFSRAAKTAVMMRLCFLTSRNLSFALNNININIYIFPAAAAHDDDRHHSSRRMRTSIFFVFAFVLFGGVEAWSCRGRQVVGTQPTKGPGQVRRARRVSCRGFGKM